MCLGCLSSALGAGGAGAWGVERLRGKVWLWVKKMPTLGDQVGGWVYFSYQTGVFKVPGPLRRVDCMVGPKKTTPTPTRPGLAGTAAAAARLAQLERVDA